MNDRLDDYPLLQTPAGREFAEAIRVFHKACKKFDPSILSMRNVWEETEGEFGCFSQWAGTCPNRSQKLQDASEAARRGEAYNG